MNEPMSTPANENGIPKVASVGRRSTTVHGRHVRWTSVVLFTDGAEVALDGLVSKRVAVDNAMYQRRLELARRDVLARL